MCWAWTMTTMKDDTQRGVWIFCKIYSGACSSPHHSLHSKLGCDFHLLVRDERRNKIAATSSRSKPEVRRCLLNLCYYTCSYMLTWRLFGLLLLLLSSTDISLANYIIWLIIYACARATGHHYKINRIDIQFQVIQAKIVWHFSFSMLFVDCQCNAIRVE